MVVYAIRVGDKYFKECVYAEKKDQGRYFGHGAQGSMVHEGDIIDLELTDTYERTFARRGLASMIQTIYLSEKHKEVPIIIEPLRE